MFIYVLLDELRVHHWKRVRNPQPDAQLMSWWRDASWVPLPFEAVGF